MTSKPTLPSEVAAAPADAAFGTYVRVKLLGEGGFGQVWRAWDRSVGRWVALKVMKGGGDERRARFEREARVAATLEHPNIASIYAVGEHEGSLYIAMQLVDGATLRKWSGPSQEAAAVVRDAARGVQAAHERGIIHRDIKPENLMRDAHGHVYVMDFGLARDVEGATLTASGLAVGTPSYMPPEQAKGERAGPESDVYALGATLYELVTGRVAFAGSNVLDIMLAVCGEDPVRPRRLRPDLDPALEAIVLKCMEKEPRLRYRTAGALADELERYLRGEATQTGRRRLPRVSARNRWLGATAAILIVGVAIGVVFINRRTGQTTSFREDLLESLRSTAASCLDAVLDLRRAGSEEGIEEHARRLEEACAKAGDHAEAKFILGRLRRAQMRDDEALQLQDEAVARDPKLASARYERVVLTARRLRERMEKVRARVYGESGIRSAEQLDQVFQKAAAAIDRDESVVKLRGVIDGDLQVIEAADISPAERLCARAFRQWTSYKTGDALEIFREAVKTSPRLEEAHEAIAYLLQVRGRYQETVDVWTTALEGDRGYLPFWEGRARTCIMAGEQLDADRVRLYEGAEADATELLRRRPREARYLVLRAEVRSVWVLQGRTELYEAAMEDLDAALRLDPRGAKAYGQRGALKSNRSSRLMTLSPECIRLADEAEEDFKQALEIEPDDITTLQWRGITMMNVARFQSEAGEDPWNRLQASHDAYNKLVELAPGFVPGWIGRGEVRWRLAVEEERRGRSGVAILTQGMKDLQAAMSLDPRDWEPHYGLALAAASWAVALSRRGVDERSTLETAEKSAERAVELSPREPRARIMLGDVRLRVAQSRQQRRQDPATAARGAVAEFTKAIDLGVEEALVWFGRGQARGLTGDFKGAESDFTEALKRSPRWVACLVRRGELRWTWARSGGSPSLNQAALEDLELAVSLAPSLAEAWHELSLVCSTLSFMTDADEALRYSRRSVEACEKVVLFEPRVAGYWTHLGGAQVNLGNLLAHCGESPLKAWRAGIEALDHSLKLDAQDPTTWHFRGNAFVSRADWLAHRGENAKADYAEALKCFERTAELHPAMKAALKAQLDRCREGMK